ncbi:hypothetical protein GWI33_013135 [Rhynchophorus ferrugineus]|uniref:Uncharacterized protein n=1 Tax=Rhynchophorus ferrugineus TaxID=354439 RepID=A0A834I7M7_RHYFE|nr:hypothetical protein GWI33_013135 [Rhynchophorus ferrugineus]
MRDNSELNTKYLCEALYCGVFNKINHLFCAEFSHFRPFAELKPKKQLENDVEEGWSKEDGVVTGGGGGRGPIKEQDGDEISLVSVPPETFTPDILITDCWKLMSLQDNLRRRFRGISN